VTLASDVTHSSAPTKLHPCFLCGSRLGFGRKADKVAGDADGNIVKIERPEIAVPLRNTTVSAMKLGGSFAYLIAAPPPKMPPIADVDPPVCANIGQARP